MRLEGQKIIVTGGTGGIGSATVRAYVKEGAKVAIVDVNDEHGAEFESEANVLANGSGMAKYYHVDLSSVDEIFTQFQKITEDLGGLDVLAHVAARDDLKKQPEEWTESEMNAYWAININGTIATNQAAFRVFKGQNHGVIINYSSDTALSGSEIQGIYAASKGAVLSWTRTIARSDWARKHSVRANAVCPQMMTPLYQHHIDQMDEAQKAAFIESRKAAYPLYGWPGDPDRDCAPVMVFLASEDSRFVSGQIIAVNGAAQVTR